MKEETSFNFNMSALRVWTLLTDLNGFSRWHPVYRMNGVAELGAEVDVSWLLFKGDRRLTTQLIVNKLEKPKAIGWEMGIPGLLIFDERYDIAPVANGVCVHHAVECRGVFGGLLGRFIRRGLRRTMRHQDAAFLTFLRRQSRLPRPIARPRQRPGKPPRSGGAANDRH